MENVIKSTIFDELINSVDERFVFGYAIITFPIFFCYFAPIFKKYQTSR